MIENGLFHVNITHLFIMVDIVYVINLDDRVDRYDGFMIDIEKVGLTSKVERVSAIKHDIGIIGCGKSHILTLEKFLESGKDSALICEDDLRWRDYNKVIEILEKINTVDYDIICFSTNPGSCDFKIDKSEYNFLHKARGLQTTSCYLITREFAPILLDTMREGLMMLEKTRDIPMYALDQYWKILQPQSKWFLTNPILGYQCEGYSDIEKRNVNYGC
jgi:GR25 family glycosyltransferase involved in LPS biosynthesis